MEQIGVKLRIVPRELSIKVEAKQVGLFSDQVDMIELRLGDYLVVYNTITEYPSREEFKRKH